ncbi:Fc.00g073090.m01.CDS01 [Cosmosporella sp. VM-42]
MPIRKPAVKQSNTPVDPSPTRTGDYSLSYIAPRAYQALNTAPAPTPVKFDGAGVPVVSTHTLDYFYNVAASFYADNPSSAASITQAAVPRAIPPPGLSNPNGSAGPVQADAPPGYYEDLEQTLCPADSSATMVLWLFRQTQSHIRPVAERFHLGPADRQPLYALTAQPSVRSHTEFNTLAVQRRDPITGVWAGVCTADIEPSLELARPGTWRVASLSLDAVPVWQKMVGGRTVEQSVVGGRGNRLRLMWGDKPSLGKLGDAYGLWWESGEDGGTAEAFFVCEGWQGFDSKAAGIVKAPTKCLDGSYDDPRRSLRDLATVYFHSDGKTPPQFICGDAATHVRIDIVMSALMAVMVVETRKVSLVKEMGSLPAYDSLAHWNSRLAEEGVEGVEFGQ